jgi:hypothetical protein
MGYGVLFLFFEIKSTKIPRGVHKVLTMECGALFSTEVLTMECGAWDDAGTVHWLA